MSHVIFDTSDLHDGEIMLRLTRTCGLTGGAFVKEKDIPKDSEMHREGKRRVRVYRFEL